MLEIKSVQDAAGKFYSCPSVTDAADIQQRWFVTPLVIILCPINSTHNESHAPQLLTLGLQSGDFQFLRYLIFPREKHLDMETKHSILDQFQLWNEGVRQYGRWIPPPPDSGTLCQLIYQFLEGLLPLEKGEGGIYGLNQDFHNQVGSFSAQSNELLFNFFF